MYKKTQTKPKKPQPERPYTDEDVKIVKRIEKCANYYEVLMVDKNAAPSTIQRAYKKLAVRVHPDKNKAPGATAAFRLIKQAVTILGNPRTRESYDTDFCLSTRSRNGVRVQEEEVREFFEKMREEFEEMRKENAKNTEKKEPSFNYSPFHVTRTDLIFLAFLIAIVYVIFLGITFFILNDPGYDYDPSPSYPILRKTKRMGIPYYVNKNFMWTKAAEDRVEEHAIKRLEQQCRWEESFKNEMIADSRALDDEILYKSALALTTESCDTYHRLKNFGKEILIRKT